MDSFRHTYYTRGTAGLLELRTVSRRGDTVVRVSYLIPSGSIPIRVDSTSYWKTPDDRYARGYARVFESDRGPGLDSIVHWFVDSIRGRRYAARYRWGTSAGSDAAAKASIYLDTTFTRGDTTVRESYEFDEWGCLPKWPARVTELLYDGAGRLTYRRQRVYNDSLAPFLTHESSRAYDQRGRRYALDSSRHFVNANYDMEDRYSSRYEWPEDGLAIETITTSNSMFDSIPRTNTTLYKYDRRNRLVAKQFYGGTDTSGKPVARQTFEYRRTRGKRLHVRREVHIGEVSTAQRDLVRAAVDDVTFSKPRRGRK